MEISDIKIRKTMHDGRLRIKVVQGDDRLFVAMPSRREEHGVYRDIIHPISTNARSALENSIIEAYRQYIS